MSGDSAGKRRVVKRREEQRKAKLERRESRGGESGPDAAEQDALLEKFRLLNEARAAGQIDNETFYAEESELKKALGIETE